ncbi:hypothetical protein MMC28_008101 [Mycoblastus sanguinarius]|nr:hypothetical protein [Mycoblastus sanguinarius]
MSSILSLLPFVLTVSALTASPIATPAQPAAGVLTATSSPSATASDQCGPSIPDPTVPDSCDTPVDQVNSPAAYGVQCLSDGTNDQLNATSCELLIPVLCSKQWQWPGQWIWATYDGCSLGSFLPDPTYSGAAPYPDEANCELLIYESMLATCANSNQYNQAAVNLKVIPDNTPGGKGQQVNVGYPSYLISATQVRNQSDQTCYEGNPVYPTGCAYVEGPNCHQLGIPDFNAEIAAENAAYVSETAALATQTGTAAADGSLLDGFDTGGGN